jgi:hypothetical protein
MQEISGDINQGEAFAASFEIVWIYPTDAPDALICKG